MKEIFKNMDKIVEVMDDAIKKLKPRKSIFLVVGQNIDYDMKISGMTPEEVLGYMLTHDLTHEHCIKFAQSSTGHYSAGWGRLVYKLVDGVFVYYDSNVDSSG